MKFAVELDLNWIDEDMSIDDAIKEAILERIETNVLDQMRQRMTEIVSRKVEAAATDMVNDVVANRVKQLLEEKRIITDNNGRVIQTDFSLEGKLISSIETAIETALTRKSLDEKGKPAAQYNAKYTPLEWFAVKNVELLVTDRVAVIVQETQKHIESLVTANIKTQVADKLTDLIVNNSTALGMKQ